MPSVGNITIPGVVCLDLSNSQASLTTFLMRKHYCCLFFLISSQCAVVMKTDFKEIIQLISNMINLRTFLLNSYPFFCYPIP